MTDDLSAREKELLAKVPPLAPPAHFAARVMAEKRRRARVRWGSVAAAVLLIGAAAVLMRGPGASDGRLIARADRTSVELGARGVAVAEAGASLEWAVSSDGAARIQQTSGNVFYRVEPGGPFVVSTSAGEVRVTGTCFRVEVSDVKTSSIVSAAAGALAATLITVTVYEGRVTASVPGQPAIALAAGEAATLDGKRAAPAAPAPAPTVAARVMAEAAKSKPRAPLPTNLDPAALYQAHAELAKETDDLRAKVDTLNAALEKAERKGKMPMYDIPQEELVQMADRCELRWDTVPLGSQSPGISISDAEKIGLSEEERAAVGKRMQAHQKELVDQIRALYAEATGDSSTGSMAAGAMVDEISDKTPNDEAQRAFQQLARERAGLAQRPPPGTPEAPFMRLFRALTTAGDALEGSLAEELGPETAHKIRDLNQGWGNRNRSSSGCPDQK